MRLFLGKFSTRFPGQVEEKLYAGGSRDSGQYGDVKEGDYVFASYGGKIIGLWRAREYVDRKNTVVPGRDGVLLFDVIKEYDDVNVSNDFTRYKYFIHNLDLVNKVVRSTRGLGFISIATREGCPNPEDIDFKAGVVNLYVALEDADVIYKDEDVRVTIDNLQDMNIKSIERFNNNEFTIYKELYNLYEEKNKEEGKYSIRELKEYSIKDNAIRKRNFLTSLVEELELKGYMKVSNAVNLYENLLVGRKRTGAISSVDEKEATIEDETVDMEILDEDKQYDKYARLLNFNPNLILYGPPGTGKTYSTSKIINYYEKRYFRSTSSYEKVLREDRVQTITFHQSYSYEEFIEGIRPIMSQGESNQIGYQLEDGLFKEMSIKAEKDKENKPYYMIIDEINRGNVSKIFGELITLMEQDKRGVLKTVLPYSKNEFSIPGNLFIIGTMNTADRSIATIDTALRRRFTFVEIEPESEVLVKHDNPIINDRIDLAKLLDALNIRIMDQYDRDHRIGHSYFMDLESLNDFYQTWYYKILPLLNEYFYNDVETLRSIAGKSFYDKYGNVNYLSMMSKDGGISEFEEKIIQIYEGKKNEQ